MAELDDADRVWNREIRMVSIAESDLPSQEIDEDRGRGEDPLN